MILLTGAAGKTGRAVLKALAARKVHVVVLTRREEQAEVLKAAGAVEAVTGDMESLRSYRLAMRGAKAVYHICPNMHPAEQQIGRLAITAAQEFGLEHFVYHSVLHPQTEKMAHHWNKMRVEEMLLESGLKYTILQPAPYMQNILSGLDAIINQGLYRIPYPVETRLSLVDLEDLAEAAAVVLTEPGHDGSVYELVGSARLTQVQVADHISEVLGQIVKAEEITLETWRSEAEQAGLDIYRLETLSSMFNYYARYGLWGNTNVLRWLLGRRPGKLADFICREVAGYQI